MSLLESGRCWYRLYVTGLLYVQDVLLLIVRLYWGGNLVVSGWNKFADFEGHAQIFENLGIIWPKGSLVVSGAAELGCGALLVVGLAARLAALPLVINMLVAFAVVSGDQMRALFTHPNEFVTAPEFLYLFACVLVLVFGPGLISLDALLGIFLGRLPPQGSEARSALRTESAELPSHGRREFAKLAAAAFAGLAAGLLIRHAAAPPAPTDEKSAGSGSPPDEKSAKGRLSAGGKSAESKSQTAGNSEIAAPPNTDLNLLVAGEAHVCRGLNTCKGKGKDHKNACAGQGSCATVESHACQGLNDCKGHGGCDGTAGINLCSGKGACAVPLKEKVWKLARSRFEQLAKKKGISVGEAPAKG
jgi:uncharacterized membrane protein YphA (DoxX/SURF4 family)